MSWPRKKVSELCIFAVDCINKTAPTVDSETKYKMIRTTNVKDGFVYLDHVSYVTEETFLKWARRSRPQYGDVVLTREAPVGQVGRFTSSDENVFLGQRLFHYRPDPTLLDWNFLAYVLMSREVQGRLQGMGFGATVNHIRVGDAEHLEIPCPPTHIQRKIGSILSSYDDLIENNRRRIQLLEESARMLYKEWFVRLRFPGHEHVRIVDGVPEGWERKTLGEVAPFNYGKSLTAENRIGGNIPVYASSGIVGTHNQPLVKGNGIIIGRKGNVGSIYWVAKDYFPIDTVYYIKSDDANLYLYYVLKNMSFLNSDVAVPGLNRDYAHRKTILIPDKKIYTQFIKSAYTLHNQIETLHSYNDKLAQARDLLLPKLMNGEVAV